MTTESSPDQNAASTIDIKKVRRRTEDVLRKSDDATILSVAKLLGVRTDTTNPKEEEYGH